MPGTHVTVILPRRIYTPLLGRFLHDRTADKIASAVSRIPRSAATIIPFDVSSRVEMLQQRAAAGKAAKTGNGTEPPAEAAPLPQSPQGPPVKAKPPRKDAAGDGKGSYGRPVPSARATPLGSIDKPGRVTVEGRVRSMEIRPVEQNSVLAVEVSDSTGEVTALFYGRTRIPGVVCGSRVRLRGSVGIRGGRPFMVNPTYELQGSDPEDAGDGPE